MRDELEAFRKQNELMKAAFGINRLTNIAELVQPRIPNYAFSGLDAISAAMKSAMEKPKMFDLTSVVLGNSLPSQIAALNKFLDSHTIAIKGLSSSLTQLAASNNKALTDSFANLAASRLTMTSGLAEMAKAMQIPQLKKFNALDVAIGGLTSSFLREISKGKNWEHLELIDGANQAISTSASDLVENPGISSQELSDFLESFLSELQKIYSKTKSERALTFLSNLISVVSLLITIYSFYLQQKDISNIETLKNTEELIEESEKRIIEFTEKGIESSHNKITELIKHEFNKLHKIRIATTDVNLRIRPRKNSQIIGIVKKGQEITVIEIHHKYLLVIYMDNETGDPLSGFVFKKYFKTKDANKH